MKATTTLAMATVLALAACGGAEPVNLDAWSPDAGRDLAESDPGTNPDPGRDATERDEGAFDPGLEDQDQSDAGQDPGEEPADATEATEPDVMEPDAHDAMDPDAHDAVDPDVPDVPDVPRECEEGYAGELCDQCADGFGGYPDCTPCDGDEDGWDRPGCGGSDCDDGDPEVHPGAWDLPDREFRDIDCDGFDGMADQAIRVTITGTDDVDCGDEAMPCRTLLAARYRAYLTGRSQIWIQAGIYEGPGLLGPDDAGLGLFGGFDTHWNRGPSGSGIPAWQTVIRGNGGFVVEAYHAGAVTVANVRLEVPNAVGTLPGSPTGKNACGVRSIASDLAMHDVTIVQGNGAPGGAGTDASVGTAGMDGSPGYDSIYWFACDPGYPNPGGAGGSSPCRSSGGKGGDGGSVYCGLLGIHLFTSGLRGQAVCANPPACSADIPGGSGGTAYGDVSVMRGGKGGQGSHGSAGAGGAGGASGVLDAYGSWVGDAGDTGGSGTHAFPGGGGGGGAASAAIVGSYAGGAGGGGGGAGCAPERGGTGGGGGGASIGVLAIDGTLDLAGCTFIRGAGGRGGNGGKGAAGGNGGSGGAAYGRGDGGGYTGGEGGNGGNGGAAGGGGGGAGGDSVAVLATRTQIRWTDVAIEGGAAGAPGTGGTVAGTNAGAAGQAGTTGDIVWLEPPPAQPDAPVGPGPGATCDPDGGDCACGPAFRDADGVCVTRGFQIVPSGTFLMGSPAGEVGRVATSSAIADPERQHPVELTWVYELQTNEVTRMEWLAAFADDPGMFGAFNAPVWGQPTCGPTCPVESLNWYETLAYANWLSARNGLEPCYVLTDCVGTPGQRGAPGTPTSYYQCTVALNGVDRPQKCEGYRLPTEAEWERAARAGTTTAWFGGNLASETADRALDAVAWNAANGKQVVFPGSSMSLPTPMPVAQRHPSPWRLFDMHGNVAEWVWDIPAEYGGGVQTDPAGPDPLAGPPTRVARGGDGGCTAAQCRAAMRFFGLAEYPFVQPVNASAMSSFTLVGFRLARTLYRELAE